MINFVHYINLRKINKTDLIFEMIMIAKLKKHVKL